ncbi:MAG: division/cell wall cluster transcriptional repressor MraZ [Bacillota bacterium]|nr:division/cell wall cluster transcriptional repressor MraZ [Bacillota bacterium]
MASENINDTDITLDMVESVESNLSYPDFSGTYTPKIDEKGRFFVPSKFRELLDKDAVCTITHGLDGCLWLYSKPVWAEVSLNLSRLSDTNRDDRFLKRYFLGGAKECDMDKQGRVLIPPDLREFAKIGGEIQLVGIGNKIEIWASDSWNGYESNDKFDAEYIAENLDNLKL